MEKDKPRIEQIAQRTYWKAVCDTCGWESKFYENREAAICAEWQHLNQYDFGFQHLTRIRKFIDIILENHNVT